MKRMIILILFLSLFVLSLPGVCGASETRGIPTVQPPSAPINARSNVVSILVFENTQSAQNHDPNNIRWNAYKDFVRSLIPGDYSGEIAFSKYGGGTQTGISNDMNQVILGIERENETWIRSPWFYDDGRDIIFILNYTHERIFLFENHYPNLKKSCILIIDGPSLRNDPWLKNFTYWYNFSIREAIEANISYYVIGTGPDIDQDLIPRLAEETGGIYLHQDSYDELPGNLKRILPLLDGAHALDKPWITLDPIGRDIVNGDRMTLRGRTSLPIDTEIIMDVVSKPAPIGSPTAQEFAGIAGIIDVTQGGGNENLTTFTFSTEHFITDLTSPYIYLASAESPVFNIRCQTEFRLVATKPLANFTAYPTSGFALLNVTFIETSTRSPSSWLWNFGDGTLSIEESPLHIYKNPGIYTVSLTAINQLGKNTVTKTDLITVYPDTFAVTADTYINSATSATGPNGRKIIPRQNNYGSDISLNIVRGSKSRNVYLDWQGALIRVDLPPIPEDLVESATLNIYHGNPYREEIAVHRMLKGWKEKEVTYERPNAGAPTWAGGWVPGTNYALEPTAEVSISQTGRWYAIDVTADVRAFLSGTAQNHGWFLKSGVTIGDDGDSTAFVSREGRVGQRPYLLIQHKTDTQLRKNAFKFDSFFSPNENFVSWATSTHKQIMGTTSLKAGVPPEWAQIIAEFSDDPDFWRYSGDENLNRILKAREHYWNPEIEKLEIIPLIGLLVGAAPSNCEKYSTLAKSDANNNNLDKYINLGLASHFMIDIGNPMHTGKIFETLEDNSNTHDNYEIYVGLNWTTGAMLSRAISNDYYWNSVNDPARTTRSLARYSNGYLNSLYDTVRNNPTTFSMNTTEKGMLVEEITLNCLRATGRNSWGLIQFVA